MNLPKYFSENSLPYLSKLSTLEINEILSYIFEPKHTILDFYEKADFDSQLQNFQEIENKLKQKIPVAYITGKVEINGLTFLTPAGKVLIPRVETEELIELVELKHNISILDIGTGSGYIAINLKNKFHGAMVDAIDISAEAVEVANENCKINNLDVNVINVGIEDYQPNFKYDIVISNPPYIPNSYKKNISKSVREFEPHVALFANEDGLEVYKQIAVFCEKYLSENGEIYLEIFSKKQAIDIVKIFSKLNLKSEIKKDIFGKYRFLIFKP